MSSHGLLRAFLVSAVARSAQQLLAKKAEALEDAQGQEVVRVPGVAPAPCMWCGARLAQGVPTPGPCKPR